MSVHFIGAGPGAPDLITVRGRDLIARCPVCLYAGSIVSPDLLAYCPKDARIVDTAPLSLDEIEAEYVAAHEAGKDVARLHSGDLSVFSAVAE
ncbi:MAG TPA: SAM-dependent methyltransferase, partial [Alphaproteobacteria bacterium]|nr:SAM-dependent methyltransferase [Alphaproteobacteria bacterium]